ncbi:response regulator [Ruminiclostridium herbifermentans]|uniref:Stage 0 sporulation protein A homolog n=1 Tax=Ruminiclostridium herbifermentans TaxID=2488810 RepID=A0A4U7JIX2_9FIRM|nr:response regulator [Ruminiclostridium herbifermentans]QNU67160.1 response regulator [Ruminiclostridium herbifermentans]
MFKVLIVDDEPMAIEAIKLAADWAELNVSICGECTNGMEALSLAKEIRPDLIITDIDMPVMNGIELVKRVANEIDPDIKFIIVSGYDHFEYAKSAMQLGVQHYILKPVFKDEFSEVLLDILLSIEQSRKLKKICSVSTEFDIGVLFEQYLEGKIEEQDIITVLGPEIIQNTNAWAFASLDAIHNYIKEDCIEFKLFDKIKASLLPKGLGNGLVYPVFVNKGINGFVLGSTGGISIYEIAQILSSILKEVYKNSFYIALGNQVKELKLLSNSMREAEKAMEYRFYSTPSSILQYKDYEENSHSFNFENIEYMEELKNAFENIDIDRILKAIESIFGVFKEKHTAYEMIEMYINSIIYKMLSILTSMGENTEEILFLKDISMFFNRVKTINEMELKIKQCCIDFCKHAQDVKNRYKLADKIKVEEYIKENYKRNLTIKEISSKLYIHPTYLGSQISKWFGCSFNDYLHRLRMNEAEILVRSTDQKAYDIAQYLGYTSYGNFLEQFTKTFSMKPSEYRSMYKSNN